MLPLQNFLTLILLAALCGRRIFEGTSLTHLAYAAAGNGSTAATDHLLPKHAVPASISRRLTFPDFRDDEKAGTITLLGSAEIDKRSGTINIPSASRPAGSTESSSSIQAAYSTASTQPPAADWSNTAGRALYSFPFRMMDPVSNTTASFHTSFSFRIRNGSTGSVTNEGTANTSDSGLTFLVVPDEFTVGRNGGWLGMMNDACDENYKPFAVEFDTFKNEEFQDPNDHHVGINYGSIVSRQTADIADAGVYLRDGSPARAWISYDSSKHLVDVHLAKDGSEKPARPLLSVPLDLSDIFKEYMFVGFSGGASGKFGHSILSWHFSSDSTGLLRFPKEESCVNLLLPLIGPIHNQSRKAPSAFIIFCLVILIVVLAVINFACVPYKKKKDEVPTAVKLMRLAREKPRPIHKARKISMYEILEASRFFNEGDILGYGERGTVYRGSLRDSAQVAIKRFSSSYLEQAFSLSKGKRKIEKKIRKLAQLHHPNLVPLRGWCLDKGEILLAYDYMPNGSLDQWLFSQASIFPWIRRYKIVKELAVALSFMHSGLEKPVVHKNVKLSNVLLDITFRAKLGDYGLFKRRSGQVISSTESALNSKKLDLTRSSRRPILKGCMPISWSFSTGKNQANSTSKTTELEVENEGHLLKRETSSQMKGCIPQALGETIKKEANEVSRIITMEEDVYCYGVMLFEIVCGTMSEGEASEEERSLVDWVWSLQEEGRLAEAIDEDLRVSASRYYTWEEEAACVLTVGLLCTLQEPSLRPSMSLVTKYLQLGEALLPEVPPRNTLKRKDPLVLHPDHVTPDDERSRYAPPSKAFNVWSPLELRCLGSASSHE